MKNRVEWVVLLVLLIASGAMAYQYLAAPADPPAEPSPEPARADPLADLFPTTEPPQIEEVAELVSECVSRGLPDTGEWRGKPAVADLNHDGHLDLVASLRRWSRDQSGEGLFVWLGDGRGGFTEATEGLRRDMGYGGTSIDDIDGDGNLDLAFSGHDVTPQIFLGDGQGHWRSTPAAPEVDFMSSDVALGDFDGDGKSDFVALGFWTKEGGLKAFRGDGTGGFALVADLLPRSWPGKQVQIVDLDGDGFAEVLAAAHQGPRVWRMGVDGALASDSEGFGEVAIGGSAYSVASHDLDGDGQHEVLVGGAIYEGHKPLRLFRRQGDGWIETGHGLPDSEAVFDVVFAELDGKPGTEIVFAGKNGIGVVSQISPDEFEWRGRLANTGNVFNVCAGDFIGQDGVQEVVYVGFLGVKVLSLDPRS